MLSDLVPERLVVVKVMLAVKLRRQRLQDRNGLTACYASARHWERRREHAEKGGKGHRSAPHAFGEWNRVRQLIGRSRGEK